VANGLLQSPGQGIPPVNPGQIRQVGNMLATDASVLSQEARALSRDPGALRDLGKLITTNPAIIQNTGTLLNSAQGVPANVNALGRGILQNQSSLQEAGRFLSQGGNAQGMAAVGGILANPTLINNIGQFMQQNASVLSGLSGGGPTTPNNPMLSALPQNGFRNGLISLPGGNAPRLTPDQINTQGEQLLRQQNTLARQATTIGSRPDQIRAAGTVLMNNPDAVVEIGQRLSNANLLPPTGEQAVRLMAQNRQQLPATGKALFFNAQNLGSFSTAIGQSPQTIQALGQFMTAHENFIAETGNFILGR
jgi:hypothetical protein